MDAATAVNPDATVAVDLSSAAGEDQENAADKKAQRKARKAQEKADKSTRYAAKLERVADGGKAASHGTPPPDTSNLPEYARVVDSVGDADIQVYRGLKNASDELRTGLFIAEGAETIKMLLRSEHEIVSLMVKPTIFEKLQDEIEKSRADRLPQLLLCESSLMSELVGYNLQRGALACGVVPVGRDLAWLKTAVLTPRRAQGNGCRILAVDHTMDAENLGGLIRSSSAFGIDAVLLSDNSCDAWYRRSVRTSMGHICRVPVVRCSLPSTLTELNREFGLVSYAAVIDDDAPLLHELGASPESWCVVMGNEDVGISEQVREVCYSRVRIDMEPEVDSLNIGVAAGILLHGFRSQEARK